MRELWVPPKYRDAYSHLHSEMEANRAKMQPEEAWLLDSESEDAIDHYLLSQKRKESSGQVYSSSSSSPIWTEVGGTKSWELSDGELKTLQKQCFKLYHLNAFAGNIIDIYSFYTMGDEGLKADWRTDTTTDWWNLLAKRNKWIGLTKDICQVTFITGECYSISFPLTDPDAEVQKKKLDVIQVVPTEITKIHTSNNDRRVITSYERDTGTIFNPADVTHFKIRAVGGALHGRPILERVLSPLVMYDDWLISLVQLARIRSRIPLIRYRSGLKKSGIPIKSLPESGAVIDAHESIERWEFPALNIGASDSAQVGLEIKQYISAGVNLPGYMVFGEGSTSSVIESTPLTLFKSMQGVFREFFEELILKMMPAEVKVDAPTLTFPGVDLRNFADKSRAVTNEVGAGLRSKRSAQLLLGLDPEEEDMWMKKELGLDDDDIEMLPEALLKKIVDSVLFHAPAVRKGLLRNQFLEKLVNVFDKRGLDVS